MSALAVGVCVVVLVGAGLAVALFMRRLKTMKVEVEAAKAGFRAQVGYDYASALTVGAPPCREKRTPAGVFSHHFEVYREGQTRVTAQGWELVTQTAPRVALQLFDKSLLGAVRALKNLVGPIQRTVTPRLPGPHPTGDQELDARFALYAEDVPAACALVMRPEVRKALLELASVAMRVDATGAGFGDPSDANVYASGASRVDLSPAPAIRSAARVHRAVERLLELVTAPKP